MPGDAWVVDASVLGAAFFEEAATPAARRFLSNETELIAPSLLAYEIASIAAKKTWRGQASMEVCERAVRDTRRLAALVEPRTELMLTAYGWAREHRLSAYDASYLALAQSLSLTVVTLDERLVARARAAGLSAHITLLPGLPTGQP